jgi:hypothetical protein
MDDLTSVDATDLCAEEHPPVIPLLDTPGLLDIGESVMLLVGAPGAGKTQLALCLAASIAAGRELHGLRSSCTQQAKVLLIESDMSRTRIRERLAPLIEHYDIPRGYLRVSVLEDSYVDLVRDQEILAKLVQRESPALLILDALSELIDGEENARVDSRDAMRVLRRLNKLGAAVLALHHNRKPGAPVKQDSLSIADIRGSGAIVARSDSILALKPSDTGISAAWIRARDAERPLTVALAYDWRAGGIVIPAPSPRPRGRPDTSRAAILEALRHHGGSASTAELARACQRNAVTIQRACARLEADGALSSLTGSRGAKRWILRPAAATDA